MIWLFYTKIRQKSTVREKKIPQILKIREVLFQYWRKNTKTSPIIIRKSPAPYDEQKMFSTFTQQGFQPY